MEISLPLNISVLVASAIAVVIALLFGAIEAYMFHKDKKLGITYPYIHFFFTGVRFATYLSLVWIANIHLVYLVPISLTFPYFHDGMYYVTRNKLNPKIYRKRWKARSYDTSALLSFNYDGRTVLLIIGVCIHVWIYLYTNAPK